MPTVKGDGHPFLSKQKRQNLFSVLPFIFQRKHHGVKFLILTFSGASCFQTAVSDFVFFLISKCSDGVPEIPL